MAKQRWGTFSVADHLNVRSLVPDVLLFDRLVFPYPSDKAEWTYWNREGWDPALLDYCFLKLEELVGRAARAAGEMVATFVSSGSEM